MSGEVGWNIGIQAFREACGNSVSEAVETKSQNVVPDTSSARTPTKG